MYHSELGGAAPLLTRWKRGGRGGAGKGRRKDGGEKAKGGEGGKGRGWFGREGKGEGVEEERVQGRGYKRRKINGKRSLVVREGMGGTNIENTKRRQSRGTWKTD